MKWLLLVSSDALRDDVRADGIDVVGETRGELDQRPPASAFPLETAGRRRRGELVRVQ